MHLLVGNKDRKFESNDTIGFFAGAYQRCTLVTMTDTTDAKHTCSYVCDITNAATMEVKLLPKIDASRELEVCDIRMN